MILWRKAFEKFSCDSWSEAWSQMFNCQAMKKDVSGWRSTPPAKFNRIEVPLPKILIIQDSVALREMVAQNRKDHRVIDYKKTLCTSTLHFGDKASFL